MKILLLGLSGSGKSTVAKLIAKKLDLKLIEADDEVEKYNGGVWPDNDEIITKVFKETDKKVINIDNVLYVISWMNHDIVRSFYNQGFTIYEMHAEFDELVRRKKERDNISPEKIEKFKLTYIEYFNTLLAQNMLGLYRLSIDTTSLSTDDIFKKVIAQHIFP
jgi:shikimate kinase